MASSWDPSLTTGVKLVDDQHKELFRQCDILNEAMQKGEGKTVVAKTIDFLSNYVVTHFQQEEKYMAETNCPVAEANKKAHVEFLDKYNKLVSQYKSGSTAVVLEIADMLRVWLTKHIKAIDMQMKKPELVGSH